MSRRQKRLIAIILILVILLAALGAYFWFYKRTKKLSFNISAAAQGTITPPEFLFAFSGSGFDRLQRPIGILVDGNRVYVADSLRASIQVFDANGKSLGSFGTSQTTTPLYIAKNPKDGILYVSDRRRYAVLKFTTDGKYLGTFNPNLPKSQLPKFKVPPGIEWQPLALAFAPNGTMYATEVLNGHRLLIFSPTGRFLKSIGTVGIANDPGQGEKVFQWPNGLAIVGNELYVADSNNQRLKVYTLDGRFKRMIVTRGLPRGVVGLDRIQGDDKKAPTRLVTIDTLAHDATIWNADGDKVLTFGEQGVLDGQFSYPGGISRGARNKLYIADTANGRVQVWGWPVQAAGIPLPPKKTLPLCLLPLLLLPFLLLLRKREYFATADFVEQIVEREEADRMVIKRVKWITTEDEYKRIELLSTETVDMGKLFTPVEFSESDVKALMDKYELDRTTAILLAVAQRSRLACTEDDDLRRMAKVLEIEVVNVQEFVERRENKG